LPDAHFSQGARRRDSCGRAQYHLRDQGRRPRGGHGEREANCRRFGCGSDRRSGRTRRLFWCAAMTAALRVENLAGGYGKLKVFQDIALTLERGETVGLLGPNGAGKTTLLRTLAGLLPRFSGSILLGDLDITTLA